VNESPASIRAWVAEVCRHARLPGLAGEFSDAVLARLRRGEREYGAGSFRRIGLERILDEAIEETVDISGWLVLAVVMLYEELDAGGQVHAVMDAHEHVVRAAALGVQAREEIRAAARRIQA
jgi:hypothetical protein